ncbi:MAG: hypothetical protein EOO77_29430 [Oxalobacteraceae bacterium]|nr:MAG: hypothetical protein EOO77_29430 [Oxalobacteraceae bacterium]
MIVRRCSRSWSDADRERLRAMFATEPVRTIAVVLGRSEATVWSQAALMGLTRPLRTSTKINAGQ